MLSIFFISLLFVLNLLIFIPFFNLGLFGDDWLTIFRYFYYTQDPKHLGPYSTAYFNQFTYFINSYGPQDTIMALLYKIFGEFSNIYFILSYILRVSAGFAIFLPAYYITKNKIASWFAVFFFLFSSIGLEASTWVFNLPSYLVIMFFSLMLYFYLKNHQEKKVKALLLSYLFFALAFLSSPIRAHGLLPFLIFLEVLWLITERNKKSFKFGLLKILGFVAIFMAIYLLGFKDTISGNPAIAITISLKDKLQLLSQHHFDFLFYPIATLGNIITPDHFLPTGAQIVSFSQYIKEIFLPIFLIYSIVAFILKHHIGNLNRKFFSFTTLAGLLWSLIVSVIIKSSPGTYSNPTNAASLLIGGLLLTLVLTLLSFLKTNKIIKIGLLITLGWTIISYLYPWWQSNISAIFPTTHRYLIVSSVGISLLLAEIISLGKNSKGVFALVSVATVLLVANLFYTRSILEIQYQTHNRKVVNKIWSQIPYVAEVGKSTEPLIFYFAGDGLNDTIIRDSVTFGFPPHTALIYNIKEENLMPIPINDWTLLTSAVIDGKSLPAFGRPSIPISVNRIYAFQLQGQDNLINITDQVRNKLTRLK